MSVMLTTRSTQFAPAGKLVQFPATAARDQHILNVDFRSPDGRRWQAIGGGASIAEAIRFAREACPDNIRWDPVGWDDLYGD